MKKNRFYEQVSEDTYNIDVELLYKYATEYDYGEDEEGLADEIEEALDVAESCGTYWSDYNPRYSNNPFNYGFELNGYLFIYDYTGVAGKYWNEGDGLQTLCRPW